MGSLGYTEILVIILVVLLLFGAKKIPDVMRAFGQGLREFKKATSEATQDIRKAIDENPAEDRKEEDTREQDV